MPKDLENLTKGHRRRPLTLQARAALDGWHILRSLMRKWLVVAATGAPIAAACRPNVAHWHRGGRPRRGAGMSRGWQLVNGKPELRAVLQQQLQPRQL